MKTSMSDRSSPDSINRDRAVNPPRAGVGAWLFRHRTSLPLPVALAIVIVPAGEASTALVGGGIIVTLLGELLRLWGVHHIGVISRTRSDRLGPLVATGPFAILRNPLYVGNIALWVGFALTARLAWLAPVIVVLLGLEYHAIVRWEEELLESRLGEAYRAYAARVNRWIPAFNRGARARRSENNPEGDLSAGSAVSAVERDPYSWPETLFSERGTLLAIAGGYLLLWLKSKG
jgi:protein-S-isoprenylcysteine O-methyltransferase Ste14